MPLRRRAAAFSRRSTSRRSFTVWGHTIAETGETKPVGQKTYSEVFAETLVKLADGERESCRRLPRPCRTAPPSTSSGRIIRHATSTSASPRSTRSFSRPAWRRRVSSRSAPFTRLSCSGPSTPSFTTCACRSCPWSSAWTAADFRGDDGPTHHGLFDISYLRGIPNIVHMVPKDEDELADMMYTAMLHDGPCAIRYPRGVGAGTKMKSHPVALPIGKAEVVRDGRGDGEDVAIFGLGALLPMAEELSELLDGEGYSTAVISPRFVKPLDRELLEAYAKRVSAIVTFEDHVLMGGFGSVVLEALSEMNLSVPVVRVGWPDRFIEHGKVDQLRARYGVSVEAAMEKLAPYLKRTKSAKLVAR